MSRQYVTRQVIGAGCRWTWKVLDLGVLVKQGTAPNQTVAESRADAARNEYLKKFFKNEVAA